MEASSKPELLTKEAEGGNPLFTRAFLLVQACFKSDFRAETVILVKMDHQFTKPLNFCVASCVGIKPKLPPLCS